MRAVSTCVFLNFCVVTRIKTCMWHEIPCTRVNFRVLHASYFYALHASNNLCEHVCVLQFLSWLESKHACDTKFPTHESTFVNCMRAIFIRCMQVIICVLHNSKKHASNALCATHESVFLCVARKLIDIFCQRRIKVYNEKAPQQNVIKHLDTNKMIFCKVFTYPYSNPL